MEGERSIKQGVDMRTAVAAEQSQRELTTAYKPKVNKKADLAPVKFIDYSKLDLEVELKQEVLRKAHYNYRKVEVDPKVLMMGILGEIDEIIDLAYYSKVVPSFNVIEWIKNHSLKREHIRIISDTYKKQYDELNLALSGEDEELAKSYKFGEKKLRKIVELYSSILEGCETFLHLERKRKILNRKIKAPKVKTLKAKKDLMKFRYLETSESFELVSIAPESIIGSRYVWLFNAAQNRLTVFVAKEGQMLGIANGKIVNYDDKSSYTKRCRVKKQLKNLVETGKIEAKKFMDTLKTEVLVANDRGTKNTMILRVEK